MKPAARVSVNGDQFLDPRWRLSNLYHIIDKRGAPVPFRPNECQLDFMDKVHSLNIILKSRQIGFTTLCCLIYLDACIFKPNIRAGVIAHKLDDAKVIFRDKIKYPYDHMDEGIRNTVSAVQDSADSLLFANKSAIRTSTSHRSGTLQYLHISEFGKICSLYPEKAREIVTGALNAVQAGQFIAIESTAEGQEGKFYKMVQDARALKLSNKPLTDLDFKFHFYPWWRDPENDLGGAQVTVTEEDEKYFDKLEADKINWGDWCDPAIFHLSEGQKAWYIKKEATQEGDMKREQPSTPDEAFESALEGAYFSTQLAAAFKHGRIGGFPIDPRYVINTFWDIGRNDLNTIWLHQFIKGHHRFIGYYENSGEFVGHYVKWLREWAEDRDLVFGDHYLPHDGDLESYWLEGGTKSVMEKLKFRPKFVKRPGDKMDAISAARSIFVRCQFDDAACKIGLTRLKEYRKEWDEQRGVWKDRPRHDDASHGADAFMTFACSKFPESEQYSFKTRDKDKYRRDKTDRAPASFMGA